MIDSNEKGLSQYTASSARLETHNSEIKEKLKEWEDAGGCKMQNAVVCHAIVIGQVDRCFNFERQQPSARASS